MEPSEELLLGRRRLEGIVGYELLEDLSWNQKAEKWVFKFRLIGDYAATDWVPVATTWWCLVSHQYPFGELEIYPDAEQGIKVTFPHMTFNEESNKPWRTGNICVKTSLGIWGKAFFNSEPFDAGTRMHWTIKRAQSWITAAAENRLVAEGDPFELPPFPTRVSTVWVSNETKAAYQIWENSPVQDGLVHWRRPDFNREIAAVLEFKSVHEPVVKTEWGSAIHNSKGSEGVGLWVRLPGIPVKAPWQIPQTWRELFDVCSAMGLDLRSLLVKQLAEKKMMGKATLLALGFPVSERFGEASCRMHWFAAQLDVPLVKAGFRTDNIERRKFQTNVMFRDSASIKWLQTENWAKDQITSRGNLTGPIEAMNILLVGAGALGSSLAELLVRLGCEKITIVDGDTLSVGNFSRHTLDMTSLPFLKAPELAQRLNSIFPFVNVSFKVGTLEECFQKEPSFFDAFDLIIDATANNMVLMLLGRELKNKNKIVVSLSTSLEAKRLYCYMVRTATFEIMDNFDALMKPWHQKQKDEKPNPVFPLEGIGCWHPVFPARLDDLLGVLSPSIRQIEGFLQRQDEHCLAVIERKEDGGLQIVKTQ